MKPLDVLALQEKLVAERLVTRERLAAARRLLEPYIMPRQGEAK